jgi:hypothetical protein
MHLRNAFIVPEIRKMGGVSALEMVKAFDKFIAIDWSGALRNYDGIAVATCRTGHGAPRLVAPPEKYWTRSSIASWLKNRLDRKEPLLIGLDFAFGFPFDDATGYLGGLARGVDDIFGLWSLIEEKSCGDPDFGCLRFITCPEYKRLFWTRGPQPHDWINRKRHTELACAAATSTHPDTLYKMIGSKQVGKASVSGMRVLHHIRSCMGDRVAIWPFDRVQTSVMVEIYPTMFRKMATKSVAKLRSLSDLNSALNKVASEPIRGFARELSDHETDALISAAGLRKIAANPNVWSCPRIRAALVQREGWIFGINNV